MRLGYFLALSVAATVSNLLFVSFLVVILRPRKANAQPPGRNLDNFRLGFRPTEPESYHKLLDEVAKSKALDSEDDDDDESCDEKDPQLKPMIIDQYPYVKDVYTRADISSFYQEEPGSRIETKPAFNGQAGKFINISPHRVTLYWEDDHGKAYFIANIGPWESGGTACFPNHKFHFQRHDTMETAAWFTTIAGTSLYYYDPFVEGQGDDAELVAKQGTYPEGFNMESLESLKSQELEIYQEHRHNLKFATQYKNATGGSEWLAHYPNREGGPLHDMWRADYYGQEHVVQSYETQFKSIPPEMNGLRGPSYAIKRNSSADIAFPEYRMPGRMNITIKAVSAAPRAFQIDNFLSDVEVGHLIDIVQGQYNLKRSTTGSVAGKDESEMKDTRTSKNTWVPRTASPVLDAIYRRVADALRLDEALLRKRSKQEPMPREASTFGDDKRRSLEPINEEMQIVHYDKTEEYTAHHDFGYSEKVSRSINFCIYLNEGMKGGETSFPRWRNAETTEGMNMVPAKGKAMIFYMVNSDGNLDDLTQHAALPVLEGEKWFSNLWIWDPFRA